MVMVVMYHSCIIGYAFSLAEDRHAPTSQGHRTKYPCPRCYTEMSKYTAAGDLKAEKKKYRQSRELSRRKIASLR